MREVASGGNDSNSEGQNYAFDASGADGKIYGQ